jgi:hypothetical protein
MKIKLVIIADDNEATGEETLEQLKEIYQNDILGDTGGYDIGFTVESVEILEK